MTSRSVPRTSRATLAVDCAVIAVAWITAALVLRPFQDTPFVDDWVYAWSVERLLAGDGLVVMDWSSHPNFAHVLWGTLFCFPAGFSFTALRVSTWVAALIGLCALRLLLRELGVPRRESLATVAVLGVNPIFVVLSATFMTDVPFLAALVAASFALVAALRRRSDAWLAAFVVLACVASAVRVVAVAAPVAAVLTLALHGGTWGRRPRRLAAAAAPLGFFVLLLLIGHARTVPIADLSEVVGSPDFRREHFLTALRGLPGLVAQALLATAGTLGLALLPITAAAATRRTLLRALPTLAVLAAVAGWASLRDVPWPAPLAPSFTWTWGELGASEALVAGRMPLAVPGWLVAATATLAFASTSMAAGLAARRLDAASAFVAWSFAGQLGLVAILWLSYDRYLLVLVPFALALVPGARPGLRPRLRLVLLVLLAVLSAVGVRDHLGYNRALWDGVALLRARGVADADIDGGYVVDGWLHFAHAERAPRDQHGEPLYPWLTHPGGILPYQLANRAVAGWRVLDRVPYRRWLGRDGAIHVLERTSAAER